MTASTILPAPPLLATAVALAFRATETWLAPSHQQAARAWLMRCVDLDPHTELPSYDATVRPNQQVDELLDLAWRSLPQDLRVTLGQVFTPRRVARQLLKEMGFPSADPQSGHLLDPACGGGIFLIESAMMRAEALRDQGVLPQQIAETLLRTTHGVDIHPAACQLARLFLGLEVVRALSDAARPDFSGLPLPSVLQGDAQDRSLMQKFLQGMGTDTLAWIVGNPPYLEAKRMPKDLRSRLRSLHGARLKGAFDYYICFLWLGLDCMGPETVCGWVLPNKFQVARYAESIRSFILDNDLLDCIVDLSEMDVFRKINVYPILLILRQQAERQTFKSCWNVQKLPAKSAPLTGSRVPVSLLREVKTPPVFFTLPDSPVSSIVQRLITELPRLESQAAIRSTCSFHRKGLRERFIHPEEDLPYGLPYLGGRSYSKRNEIQPFRVAWQRYRIRYEQDTFKEIGNPLPSLHDVFLRPKVIYCQHARTMVAWCDRDGRYVTKDVYPVALPHEATETAAASLTAIFNSRVFSVVYHLLFRGIQVSAAYLHFLPVYLRQMPVPVVDANTQRTIARSTLGLQQEDLDDKARARRYARLDATVSRLYELSHAEQTQITDYANQILGFDQPLSRH